MAAPNSCIFLDWRTDINVGDLIHTINRKLVGIEKDGYADMVMYGSMTGVKGAELLYIDDNGDIVDNKEEGTRMFAFKGQKTVRKRDVTYLLRLSAVCDRMLKDINKGILIPQRQFGYYWPSKVLPSEVAKKMVIDLALTLRIHPWRFGIVPDCDGRVFLPPGFKIDAVVCEDIFNLKQSGGTGRSRKTLQGFDQPIPPLIVKMAVYSPGGQAVRAVVVVEHRNIKFMLASLGRRNDPRLQGILFVMVSSMLCVCIFLLTCSRRRDMPTRRLENSSTFLEKTKRARRPSFCSSPIAILMGSTFIPSWSTTRSAGHMTHSRRSVQSLNGPVW